MSRFARKKSESGILHVIMRGINKQTIFEDTEDIQRFLETIRHYKRMNKYELFGYCIMDNHVHLLIREKEEPISASIKRISSSYVYWYNKKYERCGHLFQERFKSEAVENNEYFLTVLRYIHLNPVKAGLSKSISEYKWSSYNEYKEKVVMIDIDYVLGMYSDDRESAIRSFERYSNERNEDHCLEWDIKTQLRDSDVIARFIKLGIKNISEFQQMEKTKRNKILKELKLINGVTIRQLSRITGVSKSVIDRI